MKRRYLVLAAFWLTLFAVVLALDLVSTRKSFWHAVVSAATRATIFPLAFALGRKIRNARRQGTDDECTGAWRTYQEDGKPRRWRWGWLRRSGDAVATIPTVGAAGPRLTTAALQEVRQRPATRRDWTLAEMNVVLEVTLDDGTRVDLAVQEVNVADVRRWLGQGQ